MQYHVTGVFLLEDPAQTPLDVVTAALAGAVTPNAAILVTPTDLEVEHQHRLAEPLTAAGITPHWVVRDPAVSLATQLGPLLEDNAAAQTAEQTWLWFLTDDTVIAPHSLARQLQTVEISPSVAIAGAKQVAQRHLIDVGRTVGHDGHVVSLIEPGELDQGQYDHRTDVFAVSTPGMLIKTEVFAQLDGFDTATPAAVRTVDLCWRARLAGHRVAVVPAATVEHHELPDQPPLAHTWETARWLRLKHTGFFGLVTGWLWAVVSVLGVLLGGLLFKAPAIGLAQAAGIAATLKRPGALLRSRKAAKRTRTRSFDAVAELRPSRARVRDFRRSIRETHDQHRVIGDGTGVSAAAQHATGGHDDFDELATPDRNWVGVGAVTLGVTFGAVSLLGLRHLLGVPAITGGNLLPVTDQLGVLVAKALSGWSLTGAGAPGYDGPFGWLLVVFGLLTDASTALVWLWVLALPLAGLGAWALAGSVTRSRYIRFAAGLMWASAPLFFIAVSEGRLAGVLVHLILPWFALAVLRAVGYPRVLARTERAATPDPAPDGAAAWGRDARRLAPTSLTAAAWAAILLTCLTAAAPALLLPVAAGLVVLMISYRSKLKVLWWIPLLAASSLIPAVVTHRTDLRAIFADPGLPVAFEPAPTWQMLLGLPHHVALEAGLAEVPWLNHLSAQWPWMGLAVGLIALPLLIMSVIGAVMPGPNGTLGRVGVVTAGLGLAWATLSAHLVTSIDQSGNPVTLSTIPAVSVVWLGLVLAAISGLHALARRRPRLPMGAPVRAGWPVRTVTSLFVVTGVLATAVWLTPRVANSEALYEARQTALDLRGVAAREAAIDTTADTPDDGAAPGPSAGEKLAYLTGTPTVAGSLQRSLPATAVDAAQSGLQSRTLVMTRTSEGLRAHLLSGQGMMLDDMTGTWTTRSVTGDLLDPVPAQADDADNALRTVAAQLTSGAAVDPRPALNALGAGFVVLTDPTGTETTLAASINSAAGMASVGHTQTGWLWRVMPADSEETTDTTSQQRGVEVLTADGHTPARGTATGRARIVADGQTVALAASQPDYSIAVQLPEGAGPRKLILAERANPGFRAWVDDQELEAVVTEPHWVQAFELPDTGGQLVVEYDPPGGTWLWLIPGIIGLVTLLLAIPTPRRVTSGRSDVPR